MSSNKNKITVLLGPEEFKRFSAYCEEQGYKKSTLIARLVRDHLDAEEFQPQRPLPLTRKPAGKSE